MTTHLRPVRRSVLLALAASVLIASVPAAEAEEGAGGGAAPRVLSRADIVLSPHAEPLSGALRFRFAPEGAWARFDRDLVLSAAIGEERVYSLELEDGSGARRRFEYLVDRRAPAPPSFEPAGGLFDADLAPKPRTEKGAQVYWALVGPGAGPGDFVAFGDDAQPLLEGPRSGTSTYTLLAYAEDEAGNRSAPSSQVYRLVEKGLAAEAPRQGMREAAPVPDPSLAPPRVERRPGLVVLSFNLSPGSTLLTAMGLGGAPDEASDFVKTTGSAGLARIELPCPYGWSGKISVHHGIAIGERTAYAPEPLIVVLDHPAAPAQPPATPAGPLLASDAAGRASFLVFPACDGELFVSLEGAEARSYVAPLLVAPGPESVLVAWYAEDEWGLRSAAGSARIRLPQTVPAVRLEGVEDGAVAASKLSLRPSAPAAIRYELRSGPLGTAAEMPPEPGASSALVGEGLSLDCPQGEATWFALRYRPFAGTASDASAGESLLLRFAIDRDPPAPPRILNSTPDYADRALSIRFDAGEEDEELFASISVDGAPAPFARVEGSAELPGSDLGPLSYLLRAYRVDAAGNRSAEMPSVTVVVDRSSVYAASDAAEAGDGSPGRPFRSFDAALAAVLARGKRSLILRGSFETKRPIVADADIAIVGGYGRGWRRDPSVRARLTVSAPGSSPAITARGRALSLRGLDLAFPAAGSAALLDVEAGSLSIADCSIEAGGGGDLLVARAARSRVLVERSGIVIDRAMSCAVIRAESSDIILRDSAISARPGVRAFTAIDAEGGSLEIVGSLVESSADLALSLLSLRRTRILVDRSLLRADSGSGYLRIGAFSEVEGELRNSRVSVAWGGNGVLFETSLTAPAFRHLTVAAETSRGRLDCFSSTGATPEIWNSILSFAAGGGVLLRTDGGPKAGSIVANCLWGFERMVEGPRPIAGLAGLDALNAGLAAYAATRQISEPPGSTFAAPVKSLSPLSRSSACVDAASPLDGEGYASDFKGAPRPAAAGRRLPDIGADELPE